MAIDSLYVSALLASMALVACGGSVQGGSDELALSGEDEASSSNVASTAPEPAAQLRVPDQSPPPSRCGTTEGDEGTASNPVVLHFDNIWLSGWLGSVGTGASCYKVKGVTGGNQFFVRSPDRQAVDRDIKLNLGIFEYSGAGFDSAPVCKHNPFDANEIQCPTGGTGGVVDVEGHIRFVVIDGSQTDAGGAYTFVAEP